MYVYALGDPRTQQIRYIGIAKDVYRRYAQHLNHPHANDTKNAWMTEIKQAGIVPTLAILEADVEEAIIYEREKHWIRHYLALNAPLTNIMHNKNEHVQEVCEHASYNLEHLLALEPQKIAMQKAVPVGKVFAVEGGYEIFWCPSAPIHYNDKVPYAEKVYTTRPAAYRRVKQLNDAIKERQTVQNETKAV